jgi:DNA-binding HxlR family transcriptional regulator
LSKPKSKAVRGSTSGRPIMVLLDHLGRRWTLRILWELRSEVLTFRALRAACGDVSPSVLAERIAELKDLGLVEQAEDGYELTRDGHTLGALLLPLDNFANGWARRRG